MEAQIKDNRNIAQAGFEGIGMDVILDKPGRIVSSEESLLDIVPIDWPADVLSGKRKIVLDVKRGEG